MHNYTSSAKLNTVTQGFTQMLTMLFEKMKTSYELVLSKAKVLQERTNESLGEEAQERMPRLLASLTELGNEIAILEEELSTFKNPETNKQINISEVEKAFLKIINDIRKKQAAITELDAIIDTISKLNDIVYKVTQAFTQMKASYELVSSKAKALQERTNDFFGEEAQEEEIPLAPLTELGKEITILEEKLSTVKKKLEVTIKDLEPNKRINISEVETAFTQIKNDIENDIEQKQAAITKLDAIINDNNIKIDNIEIDAGKPTLDRLNELYGKLADKVNALSAKVEKFSQKQLKVNMYDKRIEFFQGILTNIKSKLANIVALSENEVNLENNDNFQQDVNDLYKNISKYIKAINGDQRHTEELARLYLEQKKRLDALNALFTQFSSVVATMTTDLQYIETNKHMLDEEGASHFISFSRIIKNYSVSVEFYQQELNKISEKAESVSEENFSVYDFLDQAGVLDGDLQSQKRSAGECQNKVAELKLKIEGLIKEQQIKKDQLIASERLQQALEAKSARLDEVLRNIALTRDKVTNCFNMTEESYELAGDSSYRETFGLNLMEYAKLVGRPNLFLMAQPQGGIYKTSDELDIYLYIDGNDGKISFYLEGKGKQDLDTQKFPWYAYSLFFDLATPDKPHKYDDKELTKAVLQMQGRIDLYDTIVTQAAEVKDTSSLGDLEIQAKLTELENKNTMLETLITQADQYFTDHKSCLNALEKSVSDAIVKTQDTIGCCQETIEAEEQKIENAKKETQETNKYYTGRMVSSVNLLWKQLPTFNLQKNNIDKAFDQRKPFKLNWIHAGFLYLLKNRAFTALKNDEKAYGPFKAKLTKLLEDLLKINNENATVMASVSTALTDLNTLIGTCNTSKIIGKDYKSLLSDLRIVLVKFIYSATQLEIYSQKEKDTLREFEVRAQNSIDQCKETKKIKESLLPGLTATHNFINNKEIQIEEKVGPVVAMDGFFDKAATFFNNVPNNVSEVIGNVSNNVSEAFNNVSEAFNKASDGIAGIGESVANYFFQ